MAKKEKSKSLVGPTIDKLKEFLSGRYADKKIKERLKPPANITGVRG